MTDTFSDAYDEKIRPLMDRIDQARSLLSSNMDGIKFPSVVVVGDQSSGKSTLLEALSLVELPKGSGIVTRCPLVLRLRKSNVRRVYRLHDDNSKTLLDESALNILKYIEDETKKLAGEQKNVVHDLIELQVEDPNVRDLTLVDLPGIARNPIADQPRDIHKQTTDLIKHFIKQEGSVILCVFPANVDVATVESFTLASEVDPDGVRTIGVITKSDLATNNDTLVQQLLMERADVLHLNLGFVAVRNRSAEEKISLEEARRREKEFFREHSASTVVGWHCLGIEGLINRLADLYADRVKETFPKMRDDIRKKLKDIREQLSKFPMDLDTPTARLVKYYELTDIYVERILQVRFNSSNDGQRSSMVNILHSKLEKLEKIIGIQTQQLFSPKYRAKVRDAMSACFGEQLPNFLPHPVLKRLICENLDQLSNVTDVLINECFQITLDILTKNDTEACKGDMLLLKLLPPFRQIVHSYVHEKQQAVRNQVQELIRLEKHDPYTMNNNYMNNINRFKERLTESKSSKKGDKAASSTLSIDTDDESMFNAISNDEQSVQDMLISLYSYWKLLIKRFVDYIALSLRAGCVFDICIGIRDRLRQVPIQQPDFVDGCLSEDTFVRTKRKQLQQTRDRLEKVDVILGGSGVTINDNVTFGNSVIMEKFPTMTLDKLEEDLTRYATGDHAGVSTASCGDWTNIDSGSSKPIISFSPIATNVHYTTPNKR
ncbi:unnamed protein product [Adineta steineri]|uniref:Dynamin-type G domain-containing protein n=2 Tax=Adineta steineri TaxID=433720 RepID=A0A818NLJ5_9BILA|nr:unnamed protein product [Adineta steineri]